MYGTHETSPAGHSSRSIVLRIVLPTTAVLGLYFVACFCFFIPALKAGLMDQKRTALRHLTDSAWSILVTHHEFALAGILPEEAARQQAAELIGAMRYGPEGKDYFWINDLHPRMVMHPYRDDLDGRDLTDFADPNGKRLFVEFVKAVEQKGAGYVAYAWQWKDDPDRIVPKLSYVKGFEQWGWIVGTGIYLEDVAAQGAAATRSILLASLVILLMAGGLSTYVVLQAIGVERRRQISRNELAGAHAQLKSIMDAARLVAIIATDPQGTITLFNTGAERMLGYDSEEMVGRESPLKIHIAEEIKGYGEQLSQHFGERIQGFAALIARARRLGHDQREYTYVRKDGRHLVVDLTVTASTDAEQNIRGFLCVALDVTKRRRVEEQLRWSEDRFRALTEKASDLIMIIGQRGRFEYVSPSIRDLGYLPEELFGRAPPDLIHPDDLPAFQISLERARQNPGQAIRILQIRARDRNRQDQVFEGALTSLLDQKGIEGIVFNGRNITLRVAAAREREQLESQLRQAQKMEAIGTLAGGIAHDFNNIIFSASGFAEMALKDLTPQSRVWTCVKQVSIGLERATALVKQILTFSRGGEHSAEPVFVQSVIEEALRLLRGSLPATIEIRSKIDPACGAIMADTTRIHQVVMNLCTNAFRAMRAGGGILTVRLSEVVVDVRAAAEVPGLRPGRYAQLAVEDTGHGMETSVRKRIFEPYFTTKQAGEGSGMGLAMVHGIVCDHGGALSVASQPGRGTKFKLFFPLCEEAPAEPSRVERDLEALRGTERIMLVDDEEQIVQFASMALEDLGYTVEGYTDSRAALAAIRRDPLACDVVITDQTMPYITGDRLVVEMLAIRPDIPIVLCTGFSDIVTEEVALAVGARDYLTKPAMVEDLVAAMRRALREPGVRREVG